MSDNGDKAVDTLWCGVGHEWTKPKSRGRPEWCDKHQRFMQRDFSKRCGVPERVLADWQLGEELLEEPGYVKRWEKEWKRQARLVAATHDSWAKVDMRLLETYVNHLRLAELHRKIAEAEPHFRTEKGSIKPHPGWALSDREAAKAKPIAQQLGLSPGLEPPKKVASADQYRTRLQESAEDQDELKPAVGPDGATL